MNSFVTDSRERLDKFLVSKMPEVSRTKLSKWISEGHVSIDGAAQTKPSFMVDPGSSVTVEALQPEVVHDLTPADIPLEILYQDEHFLVVNKPRGLATHPASSLKEPSLVNALLSRVASLSEIGGSFRPGIVHRLDKDTTGLLVVAKTDAAHVKLARQIESKKAERVYVAIVGGMEGRGSGLEGDFTIDAPIARDKRNRLKMAVDHDGKRAVTHVRVLRRVNAGTLLMCRLETGRTHQIRVHLRSLGLPVLGDTIYSPKEFLTAPLQLHAVSLAIDHPITGERLNFFVAPPDDFLAKVTELDLPPVKTT